MKWFLCRSEYRYENSIKSEFGVEPLQIDSNYRKLMLLQDKLELSQVLNGSETFGTLQILLISDRRFQGQIIPILE
jgi:hypothetical protein